MKVETPTGAVTPGYELLAAVLSDAFDQAAHGKGKDRHADNLPFERQPMQTIAALVGGGFLLGQAIKKAQESRRLPYERARAELLGAINYLAGAVIHEDRIAAAQREGVPVERRHCSGRNARCTDPALCIFGCNSAPLSGERA